MHWGGGWITVATLSYIGTYIHRDGAHDDPANTSLYLPRTAGETAMSRGRSRFRPRTRVGMTRIRIMDGPACPLAHPVLPSLAYPMPAYLFANERKRRRRRAETRGCWPGRGGEFRFSGRTAPPTRSCLLCSVCGAVRCGVQFIRETASWAELCSYPIDRQWSRLACRLIVPGGGRRLG